jgi:geranylgeranyl diphosphate synthase type II
LADAAAYAALQGGKRLRPLLCWLCAAAVRGEGADGQRFGLASLPAGCATELVHAFSLVHDDLPALDDDDLRRGRPTLHVHAGEAMAVLAGDALLALAFGVLDRVADAVLRDALRHELVRGTLGMIGGQVHDTLGGLEHLYTDEDRLETVHRGKTGALLTAACRMGAISGLAQAGGPVDLEDGRLASITKYSESVGLMFQVVDDLIDVEQTDHHAGKRTGKDAEAGKLTYPGVMGVDGARTTADRLLDEARGAIADLGPVAEPLDELARYMRVRTA